MPVRSQWWTQGAVLEFRCWWQTRTPYRVLVRVVFAERQRAVERRSGAGWGGRGSLGCCCPGWITAARGPCREHCVPFPPLNRDWTSPARYAPGTAPIPSAGRGERQGRRNARGAERRKFQKGLFHPKYLRRSVVWVCFLVVVVFVCSGVAVVVSPFLCVFSSWKKKKSEQNTVRQSAALSKHTFRKDIEKEKDIAFTEVDLWHFCFFFAFLPLLNKYFSFTRLPAPNIIIMFPSRRKQKVLGLHVRNKRLKVWQRPHAHKLFYFRKGAFKAGVSQRFCAIVVQVSGKAVSPWEVHRSKWSSFSLQQVNVSAGSEAWMCSLGQC